MHRERVEEGVDDAFAGDFSSVMRRSRWVGRLCLTNPAGIVFKSIPAGLVLRVSGQGGAPMEHFLLNVLAAIVAGIVVAWIVKRFNR